MTASTIHPSDMNDRLPSQTPIIDGCAQISIRGKLTRLPATMIDNRLVIAQGRWLRVATVHDEAFHEGQAVNDPEGFLSALRQRAFPADLFEFSQQPPQIEPRFPYRWVPDNLAVILLTTYADWWETHLPQETRKHVRKAAKQGLVVKSVKLTDDFIQGVVQIYNETPVRQGKPFPKYGQDFVTVKSALEIYVERSDFLGAYFGSEMVGFIKLIHTGPVSNILGINAKEAYYHLKTTNALIAKAVEICCDRKASFLVYGRYDYGKKRSSTLTEFKRRHGFQKIIVPRYYIPLTFRGRVALRLRLNHHLIDILPPSVLSVLERIRAVYFSGKKLLRVRETKKTGRSDASDLPTNEPT